MVRSRRQASTSKTRTKENKKEEEEEEEIFDDEETQRSASPNTEPTSHAAALAAMAQQLGKLDAFAVSLCIRDLGKFDGDSSSLSDFIDKMNKKLFAYGLDEVAAFRIFPELLEGRALRVYNALPEEDKRRKWMSFIKIFAKAINNEASRQKTLARLQTRMQDEDSPAHFAKRVKEHVNLAYSNLDKDVRAVIARNIFIQGLTPELKARLIVSAKGETMEQLLNEAELHKIAMVIAGKDAATAFALKDLKDVVNAIIDTERQNKATTPRGRGRPFQPHSQRYQPPMDNRRVTFEDYNPRPSYQRQARSRSPFPWTGRNGNFNQGYQRYPTNNYRRSSTPTRYPQRPAFQRFNPPRGEFSNGQRFAYGNGYRNGPPSRPYQSPTTHRLNFVDTQESHEEPSAPQEETHSSRGGIPGIYSIFLSTMIISLLTTCVTSSPVARPQPFHICPTSPSALMVIPKTSLPCIPIDDSQFVTTIGNVFMVTRPPAVNAYRCRLIRTTVCVSAILRIFSPRIAITNQETLPVSAEECHAINMTHHAPENRTMISTTLGVWRTMNHTIPRTPFFGTTCATSDTYVLDKGTISAITDNTTLISSFGPIDKCYLEKGTCEQANSTIIWDPPVGSSCPTPLGPYTVMISPRAVLIEQLQIVLFPADDIAMTYNPRCTPPVILMENGIFINFPRYPTARTLSQLVGLAQRYNDTKSRRLRATREARQPIFDLPPREPNIMTELHLVNRGENPLENYHVLHQLRRWDVNWYDVLWHQANYYFITDSEAVARAIRLKELQHYASPIVIRSTEKELQQHILTETPLRENRKAEADWVANVMANRSNSTRSLPREQRVLAGYASLAHAAINSNTYLFDETLNKEFGVTAKRRPRDVQPALHEATASLFGKDIYSLAMHQYDRPLRDSKVPYHLVAPPLEYLPLIIPDIPYPLRSYDAPTPPPTKQEFLELLMRKSSISTLYTTPTTTTPTTPPTLTTTQSTEHPSTITLTTPSTSTTIHLTPTTIPNIRIFNSPHRIERTTTLIQPLPSPSFYHQPRHLIEPAHLPTVVRKQPQPIPRKEQYQQAEQEQYARPPSHLIRTDEARQHDNNPAERQQATTVDDFTRAHQHICSLTEQRLLHYRATMRMDPTIGIRLMLQEMILLHSK